MWPQLENVSVDSCKGFMRTFCVCLQIGYGILFFVKKATTAKIKRLFFNCLQLTYSENS